MFAEFQQFIRRGNVVDLAVAVVIGVAFGKIVTSFVDDILMPPIGLALGNVDFSNLFINLSGKDYPSVAAAKAAGATKDCPYCLTPVPVKAVKCAHCTSEIR